MAIGNYYPVSGTVVDQDLFLGTKAGNNNTVNYTAQTVANYLNTNSKVAIGGQISFRFDISPNIPKTISFSGGGGSGTPFSSITQLIVSGIDLSSTDITIFLNYLNGSEILLAQQNQPNLFGNYKITSYTQIGTSNFYTLGLQFIGGNGTITENTYYNLSSFVLSSGIDVPTLNQVLTAGNTSIIDAKVGNLYSYDNANADYGIVQFYDSGVALKGASTNNLLFYNDDTGTVKFSNGTYAPTLNFAGVGNNVYTFQNANGTLAFLSDIPSLSGYVPYTGATGPVNLGAFNLLVNGVSVGIGAGSITSNTAMGNLALSSNTTGTFNSAFGSQSMLSNTEGRYNSAYGHQSLQNNTIGQYNTAVGLGSLFNNTSALYNTACGFQALLLTTTGGENSAYGRGSLRNNTTGIQNVGLGAFSSLLNATDSNCIVIGYNATGAGSNTVTLGNTSIVTTILRGSVGIGTTAPSQNLHISGNARITGAIYDSTNSPGTAGQVLASTVTGTDWVNAGTVTSIGMTVPSAFNVTPSTITSSGTFAITGAGVASQYVRGDGTLANFPTSTGGGASVSYYLNGSISQGTIGGVAYKEMNSVPVIGTGTDFTINADGYIAQFITDVGDPNKLLIPGGNWNFETYFSASSGGGSPSFYIELYKYDGTTFTLIASNSTSPENITGGTSIDLYFSALAVPPTTLTVTDRLAVRFYVIHSGRTITMHTENSHLSQVITTFSSGLTALNGLTSQVQYFAVGTSGTDFNISSATDTHTFNLPTASATNRGALSSADWTAFNSKFNLPSLTSGSVLFSNGTTIAQDNAQFFWDDTNNRLGIGTTAPGSKLEVFGTGKAVIIGDGTGASDTYIDLAGNRSQIGFESATGLRIQGTSTRPIVFGIGAWGTGEVARISTTGNVGIGTTSPGYKLSVENTSVTTGIISELRGGGTFGASMSFNRGGFYNWTVGIGPSGGVGTSFFSISQQGITPRFVITSTTGNVGIGTVSPGSRLQISGANSEYLPSTSLFSLRKDEEGYGLFTGVSGSGNAWLQAGTSNDAFNYNLILQSRGGNVGIGNTAPGYNLDVTGSIRATQYVYANDSFVGNNLISISNNDLLINKTTAYSILLSTNGTEKMRINSAGNVGIGTTTPGAILDILATSSNILRLGRTGYDTFLFRSSIGTGLELFNITDLRSEMFFDGNGNVGIGTAAPIAKLHVANTLETEIRASENTNNNFIGLTQQATTSYLIAGRAGATPTQPLAIYTGGSERMRITSAGNVGIGTTAPVGRLDVRAPGALSIDTAFRVRNSADSNNLMIINGAGGIGVGTTSPLPSAVLDINSTTQGFLPPRMTNAQRTAISLPAIGLMVYCTDTTEGLYIYKSTGWTFII